ncbi:MAG: hypothetical protein KME25_30630 [Symplocastrum torsivum CPER-KK1]|jgi:hypothetical protein|uniref:Uncharacterized protein n=1 Tax=Symplocastrum torsivum CPER-KK1 TaxID=450513 RepID=A0A951UCR7_9CYAN|nr:hypothetical protein [Symplocastrum torsivum CPER-KK1]
MSLETATGFTVSFTALLERYGIAQSTLSHRIKQLRLKTKRSGRNVYLSLHQLAQLDDLHRFLQEHPRNTIREFLTLSGRSSTKIESIDRNIESSGESLTNHSYQDDLSKESRGESSQEQQVLNQYAQLADEHRHIINEQRYIINDQLRLLDEQKLEIEELKAQLEQMKRQVDSAEREKLMLKHKLGRYKSDADKYRDACYRWQDFWEDTFHCPLLSAQIGGASEVVQKHTFPYPSLSTRLGGASEVVQEDTFSCSSLPTWLGGASEVVQKHTSSCSSLPTWLGGASEVVQPEQSFIWVKTRLYWRGSESDFLMAANDINSRLPQFID